MRPWLSWHLALAVLVLPAAARAGEPGHWAAHYYPAYYYPAYAPTYYPAYYYPTYSQGAVNLVAPPPLPVPVHGPAATCASAVESEPHLLGDLPSVPFPTVEP